MIRKGSLLSKFIWIFLFSVAMGLLETVVVIYLRDIYYPDGFAFPLRPIAPRHIAAEMFRELATMIMLLSIGFIAAEKAAARFAWFLFSFAVWDIFYYVFLKLFLGWPESLLTWDVLFLIPTTWVGPVIGPVVNALTMIVLVILLLTADNRGLRAALNFGEWLLLIAGSLVVIISYTEEYTRYLLAQFRFSDIFTFNVNEQVMAYAYHFVPQHFNWWLYGTGELLMLAALFFYAKRMFYKK
jgi:hypothetical protein